MGEESVKTTHQHMQRGGDHSNTANQSDSNELKAADPISPVLVLCALLRKEEMPEMTLNGNIFLQSDETPFHKSAPKFRLKRRMPVASGRCCNKIDF